MEERRERDETMWRENRRVHAVSWGSNGSGGNGEDLPPPKPSRVPATYVGAAPNAGKFVPPGVNDQLLPGPTTYLVAPNSEVLAQLMRDNETRADAGQYMAPASAFNTFTVEFSHTSSSPSNPASPHHKSKANCRKNQQQQPVYANVMTSDSTAAAIGGSTPLNVRISAWVENMLTWLDSAWFYVEFFPHSKTNKTHPVAALCMAFACRIYDLIFFLSKFIRFFGYSFPLIWFFGRLV